MSGTFAKFTTSSPILNFNKAALKSSIIKSVHVRTYYKTLRFHRNCLPTYPHMDEHTIYVHITHIIRCEEMQNV